jgi:carboxylate-amine ligase
MTIEWNCSAGPTLGVEWEVQLVDAQTRMLRQDAAAVLAACPACWRAASTRRCAMS